ncbi:50S ribosomal protein L19 [Anaplasmataceae bacterium AB001_6]|nr:50S ribosomal protein L19 [Anaplasmataceae bacterium AB001_6]
MSLNKIVEDFNLVQIEKIKNLRDDPDFIAGDTLKVEFVIFDGKSSRNQSFEGLCISKNNKKIGSNFILRRASVHGVNVERTFYFYSPAIKSIKIIKRGCVRRAKLYYLRKLSAKAGRIKERKIFN